jgi:iron complex outermembrane receptor protein
MSKPKNVFHSSLIIKYFLILYLFCVYTPLLQAQNLKGKVIDAENKTPISFATIHLIDLQSGTLTDSNGTFIFNNALPKLLKIKVSAIGYETAIKQLHLPIEDSIIIELKSIHVDLTEVTVSAATGVLQKHNITNVESQSLQKLNTISNTNLGEAISNIPGVYNISTGAGISKPVIRGLSGMRVVTYLNGLRIENQQWGGDHGMGVTENGIGNIEVIKGPASLLYGADALGGVIYFSDENFTQLNQSETQFETQFESNALRTKNFVSHKFSKNNVRASIHANYTNSADYMLPNSLFAKNSRYNESNVKGAYGYNKKNWVFNARYNFVNNFIGIPGHTHDSIIYPELFQTTKQSRAFAIPIQHMQNHYLLTENSFYFTKSDLKIWLGNTNNKLQEYEEKITIPGLDKNLNNSTYNVRWRYSIAEKVNVILGTQGMFQLNRNSNAASEMLIPNANMYDNGVYSLIQAELKKWELLAGVRYDNRYIHTLENFKGSSAFEKTYNGLNYSAGVSRSINKFIIRGNISSGFRAPHLTELISNGVHHGTLRYEIGNINLKSEQANQFDFSTEYNGSHISFGLNPFYNIINNYIFIKPQGYDLNGMPVYAYEQSANARLFGADVKMHYHPHFAHRFHFENSFSYVQAEDNSGKPFPLIPQARTNTQLRYEFESTKKFKFENISIQYLYFFEQNKTADFETATGAYQLINMGANMKLDTQYPVWIKFGVKNLLNSSYIDHLSRLKNIGISAPGINIYLTLKMNITRKNNQ